LPDRWESVFVQVSTPYGILDIGWRLERKSRSSKILCLVCEEQKELCLSETLQQFARHLRKKHPQIARMGLLRNYDKMIV